MKVKSKPLYEYLQRAGVLNGAAEELALAKRQYRKEYKRQWKQQKRPRREIRFEVTSKQYQAIKANALFNRIKPNTYCKSVVLSATEAAPVIPRRDTLLRVLQLVGMAITALYRNGMSHEATALLAQAEQQLLTYLTEQ